MKNRITAWILTLVMVLGLLPLTAVAATEVTAPGETTYIEMNFDRCPTKTEFVSNMKVSHLGGSIAYLGGHSVMPTRDDAIDTKSLRIQSSDWRWWGLNCSEDRFEITFSIKFYEGAQNQIRLVVGTTDPRTTIEGLDGWIIRVDTVDGSPVLFNRSEEAVYRFEYNKQYDVKLDLTLGKAEYDITVNEELVCDDTPHFSPIGVIGAFRWQFENCDVMFDNFLFKAFGRVYPQEFSTQAPGDMPTDDYYPAPYVYDGVYRVYHNTERQDFSAKDVVVNADATEAYLNVDKVVPLVKGDATYANVDGKRTVSDGKNTVDLTSYLTVKDGVSMLSLTDINKIFGAKVWLDNTEHMIFLTTGSMMNDNFLRACGYRYVMNGEPYYELSFNKFDYATNLYTYFFGGKGVEAGGEEWLANEIQSLKTLSENGFKTIRVFGNNSWTMQPDAIRTKEGKEAYFAYMDYMLDLCDEYGIRVIFSLFLNATIFIDYQLVDGVWVNASGDTIQDMVAYPETGARQVVYDYLDEIIGRYKNRETILMWEVSNEMNLDADLRTIAGGLTVSALQLGDFYEDVTEYIHTIDQNHLVDTGDAVLRGSQYNLLASTMAGTEANMKSDTAEENAKIMYIINHGIDVISTHLGGTDYTSFYENHMACSRAFDKPLYVGETSADIGASGDIRQADSFEYQKDHLAQILETGPQLSTWWDFDAPLSDPTYTRQWNVTLTTTPDLFYAIADTNRQLKEKYVVNGVKGADVTPDDALIDTTLYDAALPIDLTSAVSFAGIRGVIRATLAAVK